RHEIPGRLESVDRPLATAVAPSRPPARPGRLRRGGRRAPRFLAAVRPGLLQPPRLPALAPAGGLFPQPAVAGPHGVRRRRPGTAVGPLAGPAARPTPGPGRPVGGRAPSALPAAGRARAGVGGPPAAAAHPQRGGAPRGEG